RCPPRGLPARAGCWGDMFSVTFPRVVIGLHPPARYRPIVLRDPNFLPRRWTQRERPSGPAANTSLYSMLRTGPRTSDFRPRTADPGLQKSDLGLRSGTLLLD